MSKSSLLDRILASSPTSHTTVLSESKIFTDKTAVKTDVPIINVAFSGSVHGGIVSGLTLLAGASRSFKSLLGLLCVKSYLNHDPEALCIFYDTEGGVTPEYLRSFGIDPARVVHVPCEHIEMLKYDIVRQLKEIKRGDKVILFIDSIGNSASLKEIDDALNEDSKAEMQRAKALKGLFRMITPSLWIKDIPCIAVCHTYKEMSLFPKDVISGGTGLIYSATQAFIISKAQQKEGKDVIGFQFTMNVEKSRLIREKSKLPFIVTFEGGMDKYSGMLDLAMTVNKITSIKKGYYNLVDMSTGEVDESRSFRAKQMDEDFWENQVFADPLFDEAVKKRYRLGAVSLNGDGSLRVEHDDSDEQAYEDFANED